MLTSYGIFFIVCIIIAGVNFGLILLSKPSESQKWMLLVMVGALVYISANYYHYFADSEMVYFSTQKFIYVATICIELGAIMGFAAICEIHIPLWLKTFSVVVAGATSVALAFCNIGTWWFKSYTFVEGDDFAGQMIFQSQKGLGYYLVNGGMMLLIFVFVIFLLYKIVNKKSHKDRALKTLFWVLFLPVIQFILSATGILPGYLLNHLIVMGLDITLILLQYRYDLTTTVPSAKDAALDASEDVLFITNARKQFIYANNAAQSVFPNLDWNNNDDITKFIANNFVNQERYIIDDNLSYEIKIEGISEENEEKVRGYLIWLRDLSAQLEREKTRKAQEMVIQTTLALAQAIDAKDKYTNGHSDRVAKYSKMLAEKLGYSEDEQLKIYQIALLHDVGKIGIPDEIINKPGKLTDEEFAVIKSHPKTGADILANITEYPELSIGARWHHERYDGKGYPDRLKGEEIPEYARIIGVADAYDAMASTRSYRDSLSQDDIYFEIKKNSGTQFDPKVAQAMLDIMDEDEDYVLHE